MRKLLAIALVLGLPLALSAAEPATTTRPVVGTLLDVDGSPAANVRIALVRDGALASPDAADGPDVAHATTDPAGHFAFETFAWTPGAVIAETPNGFAGASVDAIAKTATLRAQRYAFVEGRAYIRDHVAANATVKARTYKPADPTLSGFDTEVIAKADADGHYKVRVVPGDVEIARAEAKPTVKEPKSPHDYYVPRPTEVLVEPGPTLHHDFGKGGREALLELGLYGSMVKPWPPQPLTLTRVGSPAIEWPTPVWPEGSVNWNAAEQQAFLDAFDALPETKAARAAAEAKRRANASNVYHGWVDARGRAHLADVPPGEYAVLVDAIVPRSTGGSSRHRWAGTRIVPDDDGATVVDLGTLFRSAEPAEASRLGVAVAAVVRQPALRVGDAVPNFDFDKLGGGRITLADYEGKTVLVHVWASWCGPCAGETAIVRDIQRRHADDPRLVVLWIGLEKSTAEAARLVSAQELGGLHAFVPLGDANEAFNDVRVAALGADAIPHNVLIGPAGTIVADSIKGEDLAAAVERALGGTR